MRYLTKEYRTLATVFIIGVLFATAISVSAYTYPDASPPDYGTSPINVPIHEGLTINVKAGNLGLCSSLADDSECLTVGGKLKLYGTLEFWDDPAINTGVTLDVSGGSMVIYTNGTGGVVVPTMDTTQRDALSGVQNGTIIYITDTNKFNFRENGAWVQLP